MENNDLLIFFKALADANRLKIVGLLARRSHTVEELAALLNLGASTVSHHLSRLSEAGLVTATARSYYNYYELKQERIEQTAQLLLAKDTLTALAETVENATPDDNIVNRYLLPNGKLKTIPAQQKKLHAVLRHIVRDFEPGKRYTEKEVNEMLARYHDDTASLRRELISTRLMARESGGSAYWRTDE